MSDERPVAEILAGMPNVVTPTLTHEEVTSNLRWCGGKLQQLWLVYDYGPPTSCNKEWRDVPTFEGDFVALRTDEVQERLTAEEGEDHAG